MNCHKANRSPFCNTTRRSLALPQEGIDVAESNIKKTRENVDKGTVELKKAREYQKSSRKKMICIIVLFIVILGIGLAVGFATK